MDEGGTEYRSYRSQGKMVGVAGRSTEALQIRIEKNCLSRLTAKRKGGRGEGENRCGVYDCRKGRER